jgi:hypothetical protein
MVAKNRNNLITQNDSFGKNCGAKNLEILNSFENCRTVA